jgi:hypothetical protein
MLHGNFLTKQVALRTQMPQLILLINSSLTTLLHWSLYNLLVIHNAFKTFALNYKLAIQASKGQSLIGTFPLS